MTAQMNFRGVVERVETVRRKPIDSYSNKEKGGEYKMTLLVPRPVKPRDVRYPYGVPPQSRFADAKELAAASDEDLTSDCIELDALEPPEPPKAAASKKAKLEHKELLTAYNSLKNHIVLVEAYIEERAEYVRDYATYTEEMRRFVGMTALGVALEGESVKITLEPDDQAVEQMLPTFSGFSMLAGGDA